MRRYRFRRRSVLQHWAELKVGCMQYGNYFICFSFIFYPHFIFMYISFCHNHLPVVYKIYYYTYKGKKNFYNKGISLYQYKVRYGNIVHVKNVEHKNKLNIGKFNYSICYNMIRNIECHLTKSSHCY